MQGIHTLVSLTHPRGCMCHLCSPVGLHIDFALARGAASIYGCPWGASCSLGVVDPCSSGRARAPLFGLSRPLLSVGWLFVTWVRSPFALCSLGGSHSLLFEWCYSLLFWRISLLIFNHNRPLLYWQVALCSSSAVAPFLWSEVIPRSSGTSHGLLFLQD